MQFLDQYPLSYGFYKIGSKSDIFSNFNLNSNLNVHQAWKMELKCRCRFPEHL